MEVSEIPQVSGWEKTKEIPLWPHFVFSEYLASPHEGFLRHFLSTSLLPLP